LVYLIESALLMRVANRRERAYSRRRSLHAPVARARKGTRIICEKLYCCSHCNQPLSNARRSFQLIVWNAALFAV
jgi:hypothetical protein